jgi:hypothetical protein
VATSGISSSASSTPVVVRNYRHMFSSDAFPVTWLINYTEHTPTEADSSSATQVISCIMWNTKVSVRVHKNPPFFPILNHMSFLHAHIFCWISIWIVRIQFDIILSHKRRFSRRSLSPHQNAIFPSHLSVLVLKIKNHEALNYAVFAILLLLSLMRQFLSQHRMHEHPESVFFLQCERPSFMSL